MLADDRSTKPKLSRELALLFASVVQNRRGCGRPIVQSYEVGYLLDNNTLLTKQIKQNILKSMYLYASSKGFYIFRDAKVKSYMQSSTYLKVGG